MAIDACAPENRAALAAAIAGQQKANKKPANENVPDSKRFRGNDATPAPRAKKINNRTIALAHANHYDADRAVAAIEKRHAIVTIGKTAMVMREDTRPGYPPRLLYPSAFEARNIAKHVVAYENPKTKEPAFEAVGKIWLASPRAREYEELVFEPPHSHKLPIAPGQFNTFNGFPREGNEGTQWDILRDMVRTVLCDGSDELFSFWMTFFAHIWQRPGLLPGCSVLHYGPDGGTGKNTPLDYMRLALGPLAYSAPNMKQLLGGFNALSSGKLLVTADEVVSGDKHQEGAFKNTITNPDGVLEGKGLDAVEMSNYRRLAMTTNNRDGVPVMDREERRVFALEAKTTYQGRRDYWDDLHAHMRQGEGLDGMIWELRHWDPSAHGLSWSDLRYPPETAALHAQRRAGMDWAAQFAVDLVEAGCAGGSNHNIMLATDPVTHLGVRSAIPVGEVAEAFHEYLADHAGAAMAGKVGRKDRLTDVCTRYLLGKRNTVHPRQGPNETPGTGKEKCWILPPAEELRAHHAKHGWSDAAG